ncbi:hypothetical protein Tco_1286272 [Tanacetum coccineum]
MNSLLDYTTPDERHQRIQELVFMGVNLLVHVEIVHIFNIILVQIFEVSLRKAIRTFQTWLLEFPTILDQLLDLVDLSSLSNTIDVEDQQLML